MTKKNKTKKNKTKNNKTKKNKTKTKDISYYNKVPQLLEVNGYKLLILPRKSKVTLVECMLFGGYYFEKKETSGISHLLEHVLTDAWKKCKLKSCSVFWEKYGVKSNAHTSISTNRYWIKGMSAFFDNMLEYIVETMINPKFTESDVKREKNAVENELNQYLNKPSWKLHDKVCKELHTVEGMQYANDEQQQLNILKTITKKKLLVHFNEFYTKNNMLFIISTGLDKEKIIRKFKSLTNKEKKVPACSFKIAKSGCFQNNKKIVYISEPQAKNTDICICFPLELYINEKYYYHLDMVSSIVSGDLTSLILSVLRKKLNLVYGASCFSITNMCGTVVYISVSTLDKNIKKVIENIFEICKLYSKKIIPTNKLLQVKRKYKMGIYQANLNSVKSVRNFYANQFLYQLNNKDRKVVTLNEKIKKVSSLTKEKTRQIIKKIFDTKNCLIVYQGKKKIQFDMNKI